MTEKKKGGRKKKTPSIPRITTNDLAEILAKKITEQELHPSSMKAIKGFADREGIIGVTDRVAGLAKSYIQREYKRRADELDGEEKERKPSMATQIVDMIMDSDIQLFHNNDENSYAQIPKDNHFEVWPIEEKRFKKYIGYLYRERYNKVASGNALADAIREISASAIINGPTYKIHNRVAWHDGAIWYDLTNENWEVVRIDERGWDILPKTPIPIFCRYDHQVEQITPTKSHYGKRVARHRRAKMLKLMRFHNLAKRKNRVLDLVSLVFCLVPNVPHPASLVYGPAGAGKTLGFHRTTKLLIDPSSIDQGLPWPKKDGDVPIQFERHYNLIYSNLSYMTREMSDHLCRAIDGASDETRRLYTDRDMISFRYLRCVGINAIPIVATQEDLMDRSLLFELDALEAEKRLDEDELKEAFVLVRPEILGAMFDTLSAAMKIRPTIRLGYIERMGTFTKWGCAIAEALGYSHEEFLEVYAANRATANEEIVNSNILARVTMEFMSETHSWSGTPKTLFEELVEFEFGKKKLPKSWPKDAARMSKQYARVEQPLYRSGLDVTRRRGTTREIILTWRDGYGPKDIQQPLNDFQGDKPEDTPKDDIPEGNCRYVSKVGKSLPSTSSVHILDKRGEKEERRENRKEKTTDSTDVPTVPKKPLPRVVKQFEKWLSKLPSAGQRGFREDEIKKTYGEGYIDDLSKWESRGWVVQREGTLVWWISDSGKDALAGGVVKKQKRKKKKPKEAEEK